MRPQRRTRSAVAVMLGAASMWWHDVGQHIAYGVAYALAWLLAACAAVWCYQAVVFLFG